MDEKQKAGDDAGTGHPAVGHETRDINARIIVGFGVSLVLAAVIINVLVWLLFNAFGSLNQRSPAIQPASLPPPPRLQAEPREDLKAFRREEDILLHSYTWINRQTGAVRIPIEQAMRKVLEEGLPSRTAGPPEPGRPEGSASGRFASPVQR
jgi:hypothetical protein